MKHYLKQISILCILAVILTACSSKGNNQHGDHSDDHMHIDYDIQEETASANVLPSFLNGQSDIMLLAYEAAGKASKVLEWMPCYCGCGESAGHKSNLNCFIKEIKEDGAIVWDDHATRCGVCVQIAIESIKMIQKGKSLSEVRTIIDQQYKEGFAKSTPTPFPAS